MDEASLKKNNNNRNTIILKQWKFFNVIKDQVGVKISLIVMYMYIFFL